ncbi:hypothetical protein JOM56_013947 [Amanita muscaria]
MPQFRDFQAAVVVDGVDLPEYSIQVSEENGEISCYIPSEVGKNFAVRWRDLNLRQRNTVGKVDLDGARGGSKQISKGSNTREASRSYYRVTGEIVRPFCFARLSLTDDEGCANPAGNNLGEVRIELYEVLSCKRVPYPPLKSNRVPGVVRIHEHSKKAMTHCVGYGDDMKKARKWTSNRVDGKRLATFVFRYRALDMLQAQGIAPPPQPISSTQRENKRQRCKEEDIIEIMDDGETDKARLKILKTEIGEIEARLRPKTMVKSEDKAHVIANEVIELD